MKFISATALACLFAGTIGLAQSPAPATPHTSDGKVDLNGIWGVAPLPPAVKPGQSVRWLLPLKGVNPEGNDVFKGLDRVQVNARAAAPNKPEYKPELLAKVKEFSDKQGVLDPAFYCKPQGVPRMGPPSQIVQTPGQVVFLYGASNLFRVIGPLASLVGPRFVHGVTPSLVLPLIIFLGVHELSTARGALLAFGIGYAEDMLSGAPVGLFTFISVAIWWLARVARSGSLSGPSPGSSRTSGRPRCCPW